MEKKMLSVVLMMLVVGMMAGQGFGITVPPADPEDPRITLIEGVWTLQTDLTETITIVEGNLTLDGRKDLGYTVTGPGSYGVQITDLTNVTVTNLNITGATVAGINVSNYTLPADHVGGHHLIGNTVNNNLYRAIVVTWSNSNIIEGNDVSLNGDETGDQAIFLSSSCNNTISDNMLASNAGSGIWLDTSCDNNYLMHNVISGNKNYGLYLFQSTGNEIYNNDFIANATNAYGKYSGNNYFSLDDPIDGNYWSDWTGTDDDGDGFIDGNPRTVPGYPFSPGTDNHPMLNMYLIRFFDDCRVAGTITARGKDPNVRLDAFRSMLEDAQAEILLGEYGVPCPYLADAMDNCDGEKRDLITGPDVETLYNMIVTLTVALGCE